MSLDARERLIVALDVPSLAEAEAMIARLVETVSFLQDRLSARFAGGIDFARVLAGAGKQVFLDLKLHDIGNTVARASRRRPARGHIPHRACLSADHACRGRCAARLELAHPRGDRAHLL